MSTDDDPIYYAEKQMAERMAGIFRQVNGKLTERMRDRAYTDAELGSAILEAISEDPEFRELAGSLAIFFQTYKGGD